jgi:type IV pilus assembly protein PilO
MQNITEMIQNGQQFFSGLNKKQQQMLILLLILVVAGALSYLNFLLRPQIVGLMTNNSKIHKLEADVKNIECDAAKIGKLKNEIGKSKDKIDKCENMLPVEQEIPSLLENLSSMAKASGIKIVAITPAIVREEKAEKDRIYQEIPIMINARSGYHELGRFLSGLENSNRFMKVADINIKSNGTNQRQHDVELRILTYTLLKANK